MDDIDYSFAKWDAEPGHQENEPLIKKWMEAASTGDTAAVIELLDSGMDINARDRGLGQTALFKAICFGHLEIIRVLLDRGIDLNYEDAYLYTALTHAISRSLPRFWQPSYVPDPEPLKLLNAAGARYNLIDAFWINDIELARVRLEEGASPNHGEWSYHGPILLEAARTGNVAMIDLLLDFGANIEAQDDLGNRPLVSAAEYNQTEAVKRLLERGADLDAKNWSGVSALGNAAAKDNHAIVELLFAHGAKRGIVDALALNDPTILEILLDKQLREHSDIDWIGDGCQRIAMLAVALGNPGIVRLLLDRGAANLTEWRDDHSLLAEAARRGHLEVLQLLVERGADLQAVGRDGLTPLAWAIRAGQDAAANWLRAAGARPEHA